MVSAVLFIGLILFLILNVPVGMAIGLSSLAAILVEGRLSGTYIVQNLVTGADSFPLMAIPLFILAGDLMGAGGVSRRILNVANAFLGRITGGLAIVTVVVCMFFAAVSGSGPATVAAVGAMVVPTMLEKGYSKKFTLALIACAGSIGVIIPPSIPMVVYGVATSTSISGMFMAGFGPGFLIGGALIALSYFYCKKQGWKGDDKHYTMKEKLLVVWDAKWALINPIIILGGIYAGIFTPTEAAAVAAVYAFVCGVFIHKELNLKSLYATIANSCSTTGTTMVIIGCATAFAKILTIQKIPVMISESIMGVTDNGFILLILINVLLLIVGCFMDTTPAMLVLSPILLPIALSIGLSPIHFGIIMVVNLAIGFITPPLGINLFVAARVGREELNTVIQGIIMFIIVMIVCLLLITYIPAISMTLPRIVLGLK
ncbi:MAG: C4-dicarboxylate transporter permease [Anaerocolumna sp.]|jgi:C4-dicarboxylate transporter DctM subunit|nr:C4-dicarboxylate transporter permease [Anaerocolumna sp.]